MKKNFLTLLDYGTEEISHIVDSAIALKTRRPADEHRDIFRNKTAVLIFDKPSLRTKITFETGIYELGGNALNMGNSSGRLGERESVEDMAHNLERWVHLLVVRTFSHASLERLAHAASVPVINALTDEYHPCQSMALGVTLREKFNSTRVRVAYIGDGNNVCVSHMHYCTRMGYDMVICTPQGYEPPKKQVEAAAKHAQANNTELTLTHTPEDAVKHADLVYTDVWASMGQEDESTTRAQHFKRYQINPTLMSHAPSQALFSHCLPAHRGDEVSADIMDSPASIVFDEAENRLHAHKAIIKHVAGDTP
jgi:ornithine carbamoyltransferase